MHENLVLCAFEQFSEQVRKEHFGQVYFGGESQMTQAVVDGRVAAGYGIRDGPASALCVGWAIDSAPSSRCREAAGRGAGVDVPGLAGSGWYMKLVDEERQARPDLKFWDFRCCLPSCRSSYSLG